MAAVVAAVWAAAAAPPTGLLVDLRASPVGVESARPRLSWALAPDTAQAAAQVLVTGPDGSSVWDSGLLNTSAPELEYAGPALTPATQHWWRVQVTDPAGVLSVSQPSAFVTAMHDAWTAKPIWHPTTKGGFVFLRKEFTAPSGAIRDASVFVTAQTQPTKGFSAKLLGAYKLMLNDEFVGIGPGRAGRCGPAFPPSPFVPTCSPEHVYDGFNVTSLVQPGANSLAVEAYVYETPQLEPKVLVELRVTLTNGTVMSVGTGADWSAFAADGYKGPQCCSGWYTNRPREDMDARAEPVGWTMPGFVASGGWVQAAVRNASFSNGAALIAKPTPPLAVTHESPRTMVWNSTAGGWLIDMGHEVQGGLEVTFPDGLDGQRVEVRLSEELTPSGRAMVPMRTGNEYRTVWTLRNGTQRFTHHEFAEWRYAEILPLAPPVHLGQCAETPLITTDSPAVVHLRCEAGTVTNITFASYGTPTGHCLGNSTPGANDFAVDRNCDAAKSVEVAAEDCIGKPNCTVTGFPTTMGGDPCRGTYKRLAVAVQCSGDVAAIYRTVPEPEAKAWVVRYPFEDSEAGAVRTAFAALDSVWSFCQYTIKATTVDLYTDSNTRQRDPVCMDSVRINALSHYYSVREFQVQRYTIDYSLNEPYTQLRLPQGLWPGEWYPQAITAVYEWTMQSGDLSMAEARYEMLKEFTWMGWLDPATRLLNCSVQPVPNGTLIPRACTTLEFDWPANMRDGWDSAAEPSTTLGAYAHRGMLQFADLADLLGKGSDAAAAREAAGQLRAAMREVMFAPGGKVAPPAEGRAWCDGPCATHPHQAWHSSVFALAFGLTDGDEAAANATFDYVASRCLTGAAHGDPLQHNDSEWVPAGGSGGNTAAHSGMPGNVAMGQNALEAMYTRTGDHGRSALRLIVSNGTNAWLSMLRQGATSTMEAWVRKEKPNLSWSHPWATAPANVVPRFLFGVRPLLPGHAKVVVMPQPGALPYGTVKVPTVRGPIHVSFQQRLDERELPTSFNMTVTAPASVTALLCLPLPALTAGRVWIDGVARTGSANGDFSCAEAGPGQHTASSHV
eukprot:TRINITY_DN29764_c0_g1_i1.p1 TRINITY_DN29764_c0_g1~~TRINITY_DN29764_c0_g1_i1.p1  ORF type:complete len:1083 (+),score=269.43 TRINITY_DN29764_c0_g1_i1:53-3250(+)